MVDSATRLGEYPSADVDLFAGSGRPLVQVSSLVAAVRRRRRVWFVSGLAGLLAALAFFMARGPQYSATTTLLLRRATINPQDPARAMETDVQLAQSRTVAGRAISQLQLHEALRQFQAEYKVTAATNDILAIAAKAPTAAEATRRANVLAQAFLDFRGQGAQRETQVEVAALQQESNILQAQVHPLDDQINTATLEAGSTNAPTTGTSLGDLLARRAQVDGQIATIQQRISDVTADSATVVQNSRVVDPGLATKPSSTKTIGIDVVAGLMGGVAIGMGWILVTEIASNRVRRREDVMTALGAPVSASVGTLLPDRRRRWWGSTRLAASSERASPGIPIPGRTAAHGRTSRDVAKVARHLRDTLATTNASTPALAVISLDSDDASALAVATMVQGLLAEGNDILAVDLSASSALARRFGVDANAVSLVEQASATAKLWVVSRSVAVGSSIDDWLQLHNLRDETEAVVVLATLDPGEGAGHLAALAGTAVVVVTAGRCTAETLGATGQMVRAAGLRLDSAVLVGTDPTDESFGGPAPPAPRPAAWA
jgi:capsular polysaccharide biosynthesis protein